MLEKRLTTKLYFKTCNLKSYMKNQLKIVLFILPMLLGLAATPIAAQEDSSKKVNKTIVVYGSASVSVEPDQIKFVIGVDARAPTAEKAYSDVESKMKQVLSALKRLDIPERDIQAMDFSLQPVIDYKQQQKIIGHDAKRNIAVVLNDIDRYGEVMARLGEIEVMRFQQVEMASSKQQALALEALSNAYLNAENKAKRLAKISGRQLQGLQSLVEQGGSRPVMFNSRMAMSADESAATTSKGMIAVEANVTATFPIE